MKLLPVGSAYKFQPRQIVCLEHENTHLYAEVIEVVTLRQVCWVRPLMLATFEARSDLYNSAEPISLSDLRQGADLVWPTALFRMALDTEVIPLLVKLGDSNASEINSLDTHQQLSNFVRKVWQASQGTF